MKTDVLMRSTRRFLLCTGVVATMLLSACDNDDPDPTNEEELITTANLTFQKMDGANPVGDPVTFSWKDLDGDGANAPVIDDITLDANATYRMTVELLDESDAASVEDITEEVKEEDEDHQFFFTIAAALNMAVAYDDEDDNGDPVGLVNTVSTAGASSGTLTVILRHEPDKDAAGVADGNIANAGGDTDVQAEFDVTIN